MSPPANNYISEDKAKLMIIDGLKEYERTIVEPRHRETQGELASIKDMISRGRGMLSLGGGMLALASFCWIVIQIVHQFQH